MRLFRQATELRKRDDVHQEADDQQPKAALDGQQDSPAENESNHQVRNNRQKKFHGMTLTRIRQGASLSEADGESDLCEWLWKESLRKVRTWERRLDGHDFALRTWQAAAPEGGP